jgi:hypothetical protein
MAHKKNPFETIVSLNAKNSRVLEYLLKKASEEDVIEGLRKFRSQVKKENKKRKKLPRTLAKIEKLLIEYPGFQKGMLKTLQTRIKSATEMGVIYKYVAKIKTDKQVQVELKERTDTRVKEELGAKAELVSEDTVIGKTDSVFQKEAVVKTDSTAIEEKFEALEKTDRPAEKYEVPEISEVLAYEDGEIVSEIIPSDELMEKIDFLSSAPVIDKADYPPQAELTEKSDTLSSDELIETAEITVADKSEEGITPSEEKIDTVQEVTNDTATEEIPEKSDTVVQDTVDETAEIAVFEKAKKKTDSPSTDDSEIKIDEASHKIFKEKTGILSRDEFLTKTVRIDREDMKPLFKEDE